MTRRWSLSDLALARPVTVGMLLIAIVLLGAIATVRLPLAFLPAESVSQVRISVNLSAKQVGDPLLLDTIDAVLAEYEAQLRPPQAPRRRSRRTR